MDTPAKEARPASATADRRPAVIGKRYRMRYDLGQKGSGGFSEVWLCEDMRWETQSHADERPRVLAMHLVHPDAEDDFMERLESVVRFCAKISDPGMIRLHEYGEHEPSGMRWYVEDYCEYPTVTDWAHNARDRTADDGRGPLLLGKGIAETYVRIQKQAYEGVDPEAPAPLGIHRDVNPANVFAPAERGEDGRFGPPREDVPPLIGDWTLARIAGTQERKTRISSGEAIVGMQGYIAPEVTAGKPATVRSEIYSLGATIFHALTTIHLDEVDEPGEYLDQFLTPAAAAFVSTMIDPVEANRPLTMQAVAERLGQIIRQMDAPPPPASTRLPLVGALLALVLSVAALWAVIGKLGDRDANAGIEPATAGAGAGPDTSGEAPDAEGEPSRAAESKGPALDQPSDSAEAAGARAIGLFADHAEELANLSFEPAAAHAETLGLAEIAESLRAGGRATETAIGAWSSGRTTPTVRSSAGELIGIERVEETAVAGRSSSGAQLSVPIRSIDVGPVFAEMAPVDRIRATWAARGPIAAAIVAADEDEVPPELWWLITAALDEGVERLATIRHYVDGELDRVLPDPRPTLTPHMDGTDIPKIPRPRKLQIPPEPIRAELVPLERFVEALDRAPWFSTLAELDRRVVARRERLGMEVAAWKLFAEEKDEEVAVGFGASAAFSRSIERVARDRAAAARELTPKPIAVWYYPEEGRPAPDVERKGKNEGYQVEVYTPGGEIALAPEGHEKTAPRVGYVRMLATLHRLTQTASVGFLLGPGEDEDRIVLSWTKDEGQGRIGRSTGGGGEEGKLPDLFARPEVVAHTFELVAMGSLAIVRLDGAVVYVTEWKSRGVQWPRISAGGSIMIITEILEWTAKE